MKAEVSYRKVPEKKKSGNLKTLVINSLASKTKSVAKPENSPDCTR